MAELARALAGLTTASPISTHQDISADEWVPAQARLFASVDRDKRIAAKQILATRDRLEMRRVHARAIAAKMIELEAKRNRTYAIHVREPVGKDGLARQLEAWVAGRIERSRPFQAATLGGPNLRPESDRWGHSARRFGSFSHVQVFSCSGWLHYATFADCTYVRALRTVISRAFSIDRMAELAQGREMRSGGARRSVSGGREIGSTLGGRNVTAGPRLDSLARLFSRSRTMRPVVNFRWCDLQLLRRVELRQTALLQVFRESFRPAHVDSE